MKKIGAGIILCLFISMRFAEAQDDQLIRAGLIRAQLTISPSYLFADEQSLFYLHGNLEGYLNKSISVVGDGYFYMGTMSGDKGSFDFNHNIFYGGNWHFTKNNNDLYAGIQPGFSYTKMAIEEAYDKKATAAINPLFSVAAGYNLYVWKFLHFFIQARLVTGQHNTDIQKSLLELRGSAGLGWNVNLVKKK